ncbi:MAG: FtsH protease activity modulator HflK [Candidatus Midichloria sp.]|nr:FtsH protease activity modulator HflK [Candidatus Midichloria sp.]
MSFIDNLLSFENPWGNNTPNKDKDQGRSRPSNNNSDIDELIKKGQEKIISFLTKGNNRSTKDNTPINPSPVVLAFFIGLIFVWLATGFYTIDTDEEGVVMRFGKYNRTATPGLNYKLPSPIETVEKISVTRINKEMIGLKAFPGKININNNSDETDSSNPKESQMLTGDENIIDMHFFVQWYIKSAKDYLFNIKDDIGESTIKVSAESAMRQVVGRVKISEALSEQRQEIEQRAKNILQEILDSYNSGIEVVNVGILYSYVAPEVRDAYRDIQSAKADKEREINEAFAYRNDIIPRARGEAQAIIEEAKAYKESAIARATGEAERFKNIVSQYQSAREATKKRMYIETMEHVLKDLNKVIVDKSVAGKSVPFFSINELMKKSYDK